MWVIDRVHRDTAVRGANSLPAVASSLTDGNVLVISVANLADRRHAFDQHLAGLAGGQLQESVIAFLRDEVDLCAGRTRHLGALTRAKLDVVHNRTDRDVLERQSIADQNIGLGAAHDRLANLQPDGLNDVALLAVSIADKSDTRAAVRIVLDGSNRTRNAVLLALEVNNAQLLLVAAAVMAHGKATGTLFDGEQRLMRLVRRQVVVDQLRREAE